MTSPNPWKLTGLEITHVAEDGLVTPIAHCFNDSTAQLIVTTPELLYSLRDLVDYLHESMIEEHVDRAIWLRACTALKRAPGHRCFKSGHRGHDCRFETCPGVED